MYSNSGISILIPTRNRIKNMIRLLESIEQTCVDKLPQIILYVDDDDRSYESLHHNKDITIVHGPTIKLSNTYNFLRKHILEENKIIMIAGDDITFTYKGWDQDVKNAFKNGPRDGLIMVGFQPEEELNKTAGVSQNFLTNFFISKIWHFLLGYTTPPYFWSDYCDTWFNELADAIDRKIVIPKVGINHLHYLNNKAEFDETYRARIEAKQYYRPDVVWNDTSGVRLSNIGKLKEYIKKSNEIR